MPKSFETGLKPSDTVGKAAISAVPTFIWKLMASPKKFETGLKPSETYIYIESSGRAKEF